MRKWLFAITLIFSLLNFFGGHTCSGQNRIRTELVYGDRKNKDASAYRSNLTSKKDDIFYEVKKNFKWALIIQDRRYKVFSYCNRNIQNRFQIPGKRFLSKTIPLPSIEDAERFI